MTSGFDDRVLATDLHVEATNRLVEALVESENRMRRRLDLLADAVIETDEAGALVYVNRAWEPLTGLAGKDCLGRPATDFFPVDCRSDVQRALADREGEHTELTTRIDHVDGRTFRVALTTSPIASGGDVVVLRDVTREHEYQEELGKLSVVASSTSNLVIITDPVGCIDWVNPAFERRTGYSLDEVRGRTPGSFLQGPGTDSSAVARIRDAIREHRAVSEELLNYTKSGDPYWIELNLTPVVNSRGHFERFIAVQADITERKRIERMKSEFVATVSHELRTPLTAISGALSLVTSGITGEIPNEAKSMLHIALTNGQRLTALINDLLDMERLVEGGLPISSQVQELMPIVRLAVSDNQTYASTYGVNLVLVASCEGITVDVDSLRLAQVLSNLLSNACKFAPAGSSVDVAVHRTGDTVRICVIDRGPGIPEDFRDAVFEKFSQADSSDTRARGGTGLGLAISRELVQRMGGQIGFESVEGSGATFFVDLPIVPASRPVSGSRPELEVLRTLQ